MVSDEKFFAWLDGELSGAEATEVETGVAADPELTRLAEQHRLLSRTLRNAFDEVASAPVPAWVAAAAARPHADVVDFAEAGRKRENKMRRGALPAWIGMAASLALGLLLGVLLRNPASGPFDAEGSGLYAAASLDRALDTQLASAPAAGDVRIGLTFRDRAGNICRSFTVRGSAGLACRDHGRWTVRGLFAAAEGQSSEYRMAAGTDPNLAALINSSIAGAPLDEQQEKAARLNDWR